MKKIIFIGIAICLVGCGDDGKASIEDNGETENSSEEEVSVLEEPTDIYEEPNEEHVWQINNYAEYFLESKIAKNSEEMDWEAGEMWYYETLDLKGGFARVEGAVEGNYEFAVWRMANGNDLIGKTALGCGPICEYSYYFYEQFKGEGSEVTQEILPNDEIEKHRLKIHNLIKDSYENLDNPEDSQLHFFLPQKGTSMLVNIVVGADEVDVPLLKLKWNKKQFLIDEVYDDIQ